MLRPGGQPLEAITRIRQRASNAWTEPAVCAASVHLKAAFVASHKAYGSRRLRTAMAQRGLALGRHRVRTLMRLNGLRPVWRRKFVHTTDSKHTMAVSANVLNRQFEQALPNEVWVCDITYIRTKSGWLYLRHLKNLSNCPKLLDRYILKPKRLAVGTARSAHGWISHDKLWTFPLLIT